MISEDIKATVKSNNPQKTRAVRAGSGVGFSNIGTIAPDAIVNVKIRRTAETDGEFGSGSLKGDIWWYGEGIKVKEDKTLRNGWIAEISSGVRYLIVELDSPPPPPPPPPPPNSVIAISVLTEINPDSKQIIITADNIPVEDFTVTVNNQVWVKANVG